MVKVNKLYSGDDGIFGPGIVLIAGENIERKLVEGGYAEYVNDNVREVASISHGENAMIDTPKRRRVN